MAKRQQATSSGGQRKGGRKSSKRAPESGVEKMAHHLPESVEQHPVVQRTVAFLSEGEQQANAWAEARRDQAAVALERVQESLERLKEGSLEVQERVLPLLKPEGWRERSLQAVDDSLWTVGLVRVRRHEEILSDALHSAQVKARRASARRARKSPARDAAAVEHVN